MRIRKIGPNGVMTTQGDLDEGDEADLPAMEAAALIRRGKAVRVDGQPLRPAATLSTATVTNRVAVADVRDPVPAAPAPVGKADAKAGKKK